jgi:hypothetical protein
VLKRISVANRKERREQHLQGNLVISTLNLNPIPTEGEVVLTSLHVISRHCLEALMEVGLWAQI